MSAVEQIEIAGFPGLVARAGNGSRPPIVLVHAAFTDHDVYEGYVGGLANAGFDTYAVSRRGRAGRSATELDGVGVADYVSDAAAVLDEIGGEPIVIGHSLGGVVGQKLAEAGRCRMLIMLAAAPPWMLPPGFHSTVALGSSMPSILLGRRFMIPRAGASRLLLNGMPEDEHSAIHARFPYESGLTFRELLMGMVHVDAAKVDCPVLYLRGEQDRVVGARVARKIAESYGGDYIEYPDAGHWLVQEESWQRQVDDIAGWIKARL